MHEITIKIVTQQDPDVAEAALRNAIFASGYDISDLAVEELENNNV